LSMDETVARFQEILTNYKSELNPWD
jgi:hypothetical protein